MRTGEFSAASPAASLGPPPREVRKGGFGDPDRSEAQASTTNLNPAPTGNLGTFDLPGPSNSSATSLRGAHVTIANAGFGSGALPGQRTSFGPGVIQASGFGPANVPPAVKNSHATETAPDSTPVEILSKPSPTYTPEARRLKIEGEVLLAVVFQASGRVRVERVVKGLGHGLDEAAMAAAADIRFRPAERDGLPFDFAATLHVVFQLAE